MHMLDCMFFMFLMQFHANKMLFIIRYINLFFIHNFKP